MTKLDKDLRSLVIYHEFFTSFRLRRHVLFRTSLHKTSLLPISKLFLYHLHAQWCSRVDISQYNVVREQVQSSGGIFADEQDTRLSHKDEWGLLELVRSQDFIVFKLDLSDFRRAGVGQDSGWQRRVWPLTLSPPLQALIQELKAFPPYQNPGRRSKPTLMNVDSSNFWRSLRDALSSILLLSPIILLVFYLYQSFPAGTAHTWGFSWLLCLWVETLMK